MSFKKFKNIGILFALLDQEGLTQMELSRILNVNKTFMMRGINALEKKRLVTRKKWPGRDNRANYIYLTATGKRKAKEALALASRVEEAMLSPLSQTERDHFKSMLNKLFLRIDNLKDQQEMHHDG